MSVLTAPTRLRLPDLLNTIQAAVDRHHQSENPFDDITMVAVRRRGAEAGQAG